MREQMHNPINVLSKREAEEILRRIKNPVVRLALSILYFCGLRLIEVLQIRFDDIDFKEKRLRVRRKRSEEHPCECLVPIPDCLIHQFRSMNTKSYYLFPNESGTGHLSIPTIQKAFRDALVESGIKKQFTITSLRHFRALQLWKQNIGLEKIQQLFGHSRSDHTKNYINQLLKDEVGS